MNDCMNHLAWAAVLAQSGTEAEHRPNIKKRINSYNNNDRTREFIADDD